MVTGVSIIYTFGTFSAIQHWLIRDEEAGLLNTLWTLHLPV